MVVEEIKELLTLEDGKNLNSKIYRSIFLINIYGLCFFLLNVINELKEDVPTTIGVIRMLTLEEFIAKR